MSGHGRRNGGPPSVPEIAADTRGRTVERECHRPGCGRKFRSHAGAAKKRVWCSVACWRRDPDGEAAEEAKR